MPGTSRYEQAKQTCKGVYIFRELMGKPDVILQANGSEVSTLIGCAEILEKEKLSGQGWFRHLQKGFFVCRKNLAS